MLEIAEAINRNQEFRIHPLGFYFLQSLVSDNGCSSRRIHVWLPDAPSPRANDLHTHNYDLRSTVVAGAVRNELYYFREEQKGNIIEYHVSRQSDKSLLYPTGRYGELDFFASFITTANGSYELNAGVIHRAFANELPCVTVVSTKSRKVSMCSYGTTKEERPFVRRLVNHEEASNIACVLEDILNS